MNIRRNEYLGKKRSDINMAAGCSLFKGVIKHRLEPIEKGLHFTLSFRNEISVGYSTLQT